MGAPRHGGAVGGHAVRLPAPGASRRPAHGGVLRAPRPRALAAFRPGDQRYAPLAAAGPGVVPARGARQALAPALSRLVPRAPRGSDGELQPRPASASPRGGRHGGAGPLAAPHRRTRGAVFPLPPAGPSFPAAP